MMDCVGDVYRKIARASMANQPPAKSDWTDRNGILHCHICGEPKRKWVTVPDDNSVDKPRRILVGVMCQCARQSEKDQQQRKESMKEMEIVASLRKASLMADKLAHASLDEFQVTSYNERNQKLCKRYVDAWDEMVRKNQGLLFWGDVGTGKSYAAACIANALIARQIPAVMTSFVKLLEIARDGNDSSAAMLARICKAKLVIFDDLGAERNSDYALERVYNIVDSRYRCGLPMIITTNLHIETMKRETDSRYRRIYDRIFETCYPMQFTGPSWRRKSASRRFMEMEAFLEDQEG